MILPFVREILADAEKSTAFQRAASLLRGRAGRARVSGLTPSAKTLYLPLLQRACGRPLIVVVANNRTADELMPPLQAFAELTSAVNPASIVKLPAYDVLPFENLSPHPELQEERAAALWKIASGTVSILVTPLEAAAMRLQSVEKYAEFARVLSRGDMVDLEEAIERLNRTGYAASDVVEMPGQYAHRGGLLDVYPPEAERPYRIEFFGDEIERIRRCDPGTQRLAGSADEVVLPALTETPGREETLAMVHARLSGARVAGTEDEVQRAMTAGGVTIFPGWEFYAAIGAQSTLFDLMPGALLMLNEPSAIHSERERWWEKVQAMHERSGVGDLVRPEEIFLAPEEWDRLITTIPGASVEHLGITTIDADNEVVFSTQPTTKFHGSVPAMVEEVKKLTAESNRVIFTAPNNGEVERLGDIFTEYNVPFRLGSRATTTAGETYLEETSYFAGELSAVTVVKAAIPEGVVLPDESLTVFGAHDLFEESEVVVKRPLRQKSKTSAFLSDFRDLVVGDYVVHVEHGIAQYQGLKEIAQGETMGEFMVLEFAENAKLYVPLTRLDLIQKYRSTEGARPPLSRLGSAQWAKTTARVKKAMKDMADELLKLYAERKTVAGHQFAPDNQFQHEFEDAFEHNETDDQVTAIVDIKRDMEAPTPMDRLLCGDVGYGKTEVAMRAAFKAVNDSKQVAVLAPTTVLAFQHFETFKQRFAAFPISIEMISRFRTPKQQKEIIERIEQGKIEVLIGKPRILSQDIKFPDLGLVIVDEEQRFGVRHKERLKQLKKEVDVLTMSATPIPLTLHMSLVGLREM